MTRYSFDAKVFMSGEIEASSREDAEREIAVLLEIKLPFPNVSIDGIDIEEEEDVPATHEKEDAP